MNTLNKPILLNIIICDSIIKDETTHKLTLIGLFNNIGARNFPCVHSKLHVYISFTEMEGEAEGKLRLVQENTNKILVEMKGNIKSINRSGVVELNFAIENIQLPTEGSYRFEFWVGEDLVGQKKFIVQKIG